MQESRNQWTMNPVTRVQANKKKDKKKTRQENRKSCLFYNDKQDFFICGEVA